MITPAGKRLDGRAERDQDIAPLPPSLPRRVECNVGVEGGRGRLRRLRERTAEKKKGRSERGGRLRRRRKGESGGEGGRRKTEEREGVYWVEGIVKKEKKEGGRAMDRVRGGSRKRVGIWVDRMGEEARLSCG